MTSEINQPTENANLIEQKPQSCIQNCPRKTCGCVLYCCGITYILLPILLLIFGGSILRELTYLNNLHSSKVCDVNTFYPDHSNSANIDILSSQGYQIPAWQLLSDSPSAPVIIYSHGNAGTRCHGSRMASYDRLLERGWSVIGYDYGGFANSTKQDVVNDESLILDLRDVAVYVKENVIKGGDNKIVFWGHSLGTGVTAAAAAKHKVVREMATVLALESPFVSFKDLITNDYFIAKPFQMMYHSVWDSLISFTSNKSGVGSSFETLDNLAELAESGNPPFLIIAHSEIDSIIPYSQSENMANALQPAYAGKMNFFTIDARRQIGHNSILGYASFDILNKLQAILNS